MYYVELGNGETSYNLSLMEALEFIDACGGKLVKIEGDGYSK